MIVLNCYYFYFYSVLWYAVIALLSFLFNIAVKFILIIRRNFCLVLLYLRFIDTLLVQDCEIFINLLNASPICLLKCFVVYCDFYMKCLLRSFLATIMVFAFHFTHILIIDGCLCLKNNLNNYLTFLYAYIIISILTIVLLYQIYFLVIFVHLIHS